MWTNSLMNTFLLSAASEAERFDEYRKLLLENNNSSVFLQARLDISDPAVQVALKAGNVVVRTVDQRLGQAIVIPVG